MRSRLLAARLALSLLLPAAVAVGLAVDASDRVTVDATVAGPPVDGRASVVHVDAGRHVSGTVAAGDLQAGQVRAVPYDPSAGQLGRLGFTGFTASAVVALLAVVSATIALTWDDASEPAAAG